VVDEIKPEVESKEVSLELEEGKGDLGDIEAMLTEDPEVGRDAEEKEEGEVEEQEAESNEKEVVPEGKEEEEEEGGESGDESE